MFTSYWIRSIAIVGLILLPLLGQAQEQTEETDRGQSSQNGPAENPLDSLQVEIVESDSTSDTRNSQEEEAKQREIEDLIAQQGMNAATQSIDAATQDMRDYALYSTILVGVGTVLVFITLILTWYANSSALAAVRVTRETGRDQTRAYVDVSECEIVYTGLGNIWITIFVKNSGQTPARSFGYIDAIGEIIARESDEPQHSTGGGHSAFWSGLGPGVKRSFPVKLGENHFDVLSRLPTAYQDNLRFRVRGTCEYETFFGEVFRSDFSFIIDCFRVAEIKRAYEDQRVSQSVKMQISIGRNDCYQIQNA